mmetsp:Transcript_46731/g.105653  ORF Transcript_46731/g.105653 Transcript_46731/m.105653 type:complete len:242 (+) Transcript_46731:778-1503(+)
MRLPSRRVRPLGRPAPSPPPRPPHTTPTVPVAGSKAHRNHNPSHPEPPHPSFPPAPAAGARGVLRPPVGRGPGRGPKPSVRDRDKGANPRPGRRQALPPGRDSLLRATRRSTFSGRLVRGARQGGCFARRSGGEAPGKPPAQTSPRPVGGGGGGLGRSGRWRRAGLPGGRPARAARAGPPGHPRPKEPPKPAHGRGRARGTEPSPVRQGDGRRALPRRGVRPGVWSTRAAEPTWVRWRRLW